MSNIFANASTRTCRRLVLALIGLVAGWLAGCDLPGQPNPSDRPVTANQIVDFDSLFRTNCVGCHGAEGKLGPAPPLNDSMFLSIIPDAELLSVISEGRPGTPMAAFAHQHGGPLNETQALSLVRGLKARWKSRVEASAPLPSYLANQSAAPSTSTQTSESGENAFARACATCHGERGQGTKSAGAIHDPTFLGLISDQALRRLVITGRPDLGMPNFADSKARGADYQPLSPIEIDALVALLAAWRTGAPVNEPVANLLPANRITTDSQGSKP